MSSAIVASESTRDSLGLAIEHLLGHPRVGRLAPRGLARQMDDASGAAAAGRDGLDGTATLGRRGSVRTGEGLTTR